MYIKELYYYYKSNKIVICVLIFQIAIMFTLLGTFLSFSGTVSYGKRDIENIYQDKAIYQLLDGYSDPAEFRKFFDRKDSLDILKKYYNGLNQAKSFQYLAMFNQGILINDVKNLFPTIGLSGYGETKRIKSFQVNKQSHDYFGISVSEGRAFVAEDFKYKKVMSALVGSDYKENIAIGDKITIEYYGKEIVIEVVGILSPDAHLYFQQDSEFYLDSYIILPYIDYTAAITDFDEQKFQKITYFAMINGYISISDGSEFATKMMMEVETISKQSGFYNYLFIGTNPDSQPYRGLLNVLRENYELVQLLFACSFILNTILISFQLYLIQKRRLISLAVHYLNGASIAHLVKQFILEISTIIFLSFIISRILITNVLNIVSSSSIKLSIVAFIFIACSGIIPISKFTNFDLISLLNHEEEC